MAQNTTYIGYSSQDLPLSWAEGFKLYMHDPHAKKMLRRLATRFLPIATGIALVDDALLPGLGLIDDVSLPFLLAGMAVMLYKVNNYRHNPPAMKQL